MPNWVECELEIKGKNGVLVCMNSIGNADQPIDFDKIIPMPESLNGNHSCSEEFYGKIIMGIASEDDVKEVLADQKIVKKGITTQKRLVNYLKKEFPAAEEAGKKSLQAFRETGYTNWYDWRCNNWDTKWNACETKTVHASTKLAKICFATAWSPPKKVIMALAKRFPDLSFEMKYWEGGCGFKGVLVCSNGEVTVDKVTEYKGNRGG